jgi:hypothetical protein
MDEFLTDDFFLKLIRLGVKAPELRMQARDILDRLHEEREKKGKASDRPLEEDSE